MIVCANTADQAQTLFEGWLTPTLKGEGTAQSEIKEITGVPFLGQMLTEVGRAEIDWPETCRKAKALLEEAPADDSEQGYWLDLHNFRQPDNSQHDIEALRAALPPDVRDGLNWSLEKKFFFLVNVLRAQPTLPDSADARSPEGPGEEVVETPDQVEAEEALEGLPDLVEKESVVLVEARNALVALWLWQRFAEGTVLEKNDIQVTPWCGAIGY